MELLFGTLDPIYEFHCSFLREVEQRLAMWWVPSEEDILKFFIPNCFFLIEKVENSQVLHTPHERNIFLRIFREGKSNAHLNGDYQRIGDIMLNNMTMLQVGFQQVFPSWKKIICVAHR